MIELGMKPESPYVSYLRVVYRLQQQHPVVWLAVAQCPITSAPIIAREAVVQPQVPARFAVLNMNIIKLTITKQQTIYL
jgi:hypothetical protein